MTKHRKGRVWQLQEAKARLSELVKAAGADGPQQITVRGEPAVVVLSRAAYEKLRGERKTQSLPDFLLKSPLVGLDIDFERDQSLTREGGLFDDDR
jgi:prevent-host-death family protein